jgi:hypothetical protein
VKDRQVVHAVIPKHVLELLHACQLSSSNLSSSNLSLLSWFLASVTVAVCVVVAAGAVRRPLGCVLVRARVNRSNLSSKQGSDDAPSAAVGAVVAGDVSVVAAVQQLEGEPRQDESSSSSGGGSSSSANIATTAATATTTTSTAATAATTAATAKKKKRDFLQIFKSRRDRNGDQDSSSSKESAAVNKKAKARSSLCGLHSCVVSACCTFFLLGLPTEQARLQGVSFGLTCSRRLCLR